MNEEDIHAVYEEFGHALDTGFVTPEELIAVLESVKSIIAKDSISVTEAEEFLSLLVEVSAPGAISFEGEPHRSEVRADSIAADLDSL
ncbi:MAG: hypothetical protein IIB00_05335 [candidate division Zixibacteria bacterium]|nr:hypothetical protein [candidate division Zixibacteria bacterium]